MEIVYFDNAATTQIIPEALDEMMPYLTKFYGNSSALYNIGRISKTAMERARSQLARLIGAKPSEIYFTSGGTEADNWAIKSSFQGKGHMITSAVEHHAVLNACEHIAKTGINVTILPVDKFGGISLKELEKAIRPDTRLISIMFANNEVGTINPVKEIGDIARERGIIFHTDAVQAVGHVKIDVREMGIDMLSLSAHKFGGPKGVGALYIREGADLPPYINGGSQERKMRAGTENIAGIVGLGAAAEISGNELEVEAKRLSGLRDRLISGVLERIPFVTLNGHHENRLPGNCNFSFDGLEGESLLILLDMKGYCVSAGSACSSGSGHPSHVLKAMGLSSKKAKGALRATLGRMNTEAEVIGFIKDLEESVEKIRGMCSTGK